VGRPPCPRRVAGPPRCVYFKPAGIPLSRLEEVALSVDELEALRLADLEGLYQDAAAARMGVSRPTFARIVGLSRRKVAEALVQGRALRIGGGPVAFVGRRRFRCEACGHEWSLAFGAGRPTPCPSCRARSFSRIDAGPRFGTSTAARLPRDGRRRRGDGR
jgi:predicted DNA-binding protein (UPF0251 family)